jgi:hypothetical protein
MPYTITKFDDSYQVRSPHGTKAKRTTKSKAKKQVRLLNAIEHGFEPNPYHSENQKYARSNKKSGRKAG